MDKFDNLVGTLDLVSAKLVEKKDENLKLRMEFEEKLRLQESLKLVETEKQESSKLVETEKLRLEFAEKLHSCIPHCTSRHNSEMR